MESFEKLKEAKQLFDDGVINEEEYQNLKTKLLDDMDKRQTTQTPAVTAAATSQTVTTETTSSGEGATTGMKVLSFLIPLVGLILFIVDKDKKPIAAKDELMWAGIGFGVGIVLYIITVGMAASMY